MKQRHAIGFARGGIRVVGGVAGGNPAPPHETFYLASAQHRRLAEARRALDRAFAALISGA